MVRGPPTMATAKAPMPTRAEAAGSGETAPLRVRIWAKAWPARAPSSREAKKRPPRKPEPSEIAEAAILSSSRPRMTATPWVAIRSYCRAPCPAERTCGLANASTPTVRPPRAGLSIGGRNGWRNRRSIVETARMSRMARNEQITPRAVKSR